MYPRAQEARDDNYHHLPSSERPECSRQADGSQRRCGGTFGPPGRSYQSPHARCPGTASRRRILKDLRVANSEVNMQSSVVANMTYPISAAAAVKDRVASDSIRGTIMAGMIIITVFFLGFGTWSVTAPLNGAVVGNGFVKVEGNRKSVQHLDGGIVKELLVKEGDRIKSGEIVLVLDDSQARAEYNVLSQQNLVLRAMEERLRAEFMHQNKVDIPEEFRNQ